MIFAGVCTTGGYVDLLRLLLYTLKKNSGLDIPFVVITSKTYKSLKSTEKTLLKKYWKDLRFHYIDDDLYHKHGKTNPKFWSIEIFNMDEDIILYMDVDCICTGELVTVADQGHKLAMTRERQRPNYSAGFIVTNKWYRNEHTYRQLLECEGDKHRFGHDQKIYNTFFPHIVELPRKWHCKIDEMEHGYEYYSLLHFWLKPTDSRHKKRINQSLVDLWEANYAEANKFKLKNRGRRSNAERVSKRKKIS